MPDLWYSVHRCNFYDLFFIYDFYFDGLSTCRMASRMPSYPCLHFLWVFGRIPLLNQVYDAFYFDGLRSKDRNYICHYLMPSIDEKRVMSIEEQLYGRKKEESITEGRQYVKSSYRRDSASGDVEGKIKIFGANSSRSFSNSSLKTAALSDWVVVEETEDAIAEDEQEVGMETDKTKGAIDGEGNTKEQHVSSLLWSLPP